MATVAAVVHAHQRRADGTYNVKIRITHHRQSVHLPSSLTVTADDLTRGLALKSPEAKRKAADMVGDIYAAISKIPPFTLEQMTVRDVVAWCRRELRDAAPFHLDFYGWAEDYIAKLRVSDMTRENYYKAVRSLRRFVPELDAADITTAMLEEFVQFTLGRGVSPNTLSQEMAELAAIYTAAQRTYNDEDTGYFPLPRHPFDRVKVQRVPTKGQRPLTREEFQLLLDTAPPTLPFDMFIISFGLMGINFADLRKIRRSQVRDGVLTYNRSKTENHRPDHAYMRVYVPPVLEPYIARRRAPMGDMWLLLPDIQRASFSNKFSRALHAWATAHGLEPFSFNSARHTWATIARSKQAHIEKATVDEALAHVGDYRLADIYAERDWDIINAANTKVLSLFVWPSNSQE